MPPFVWLLLLGATAAMAACGSWSDPLLNITAASPHRAICNLSDWTAVSYSIIGYGRTWFRTYMAQGTDCNAIPASSFREFSCNERDVYQCIVTHPFSSNSTTEPVCLITECRDDWCLVNYTISFDHMYTQVHAPVNAVFGEEVIVPWSSYYCGETFRLSMKTPDNEILFSINVTSNEYNPLQNDTFDVPHLLLSRILKARLSYEHRYVFLLEPLTEDYTHVDTCYSISPFFFYHKDDVGFA